MTDAAFFPADYKSFRFVAGDVIAQPEEGQYVLTRILSVDEIEVPQGGGITIAGTTMTATVRDTLLVVSCAFDQTRYPTPEAARAAFEAGRWEPSMLHVPLRTVFLGPDDVRVGHRPVDPAELDGYHLWRDAFARGEAGIF